MRALTLWQPWASVVAAGAKLVENRPWKPAASLLKPGERFAIHGGAKYDELGRAAAISVLGGDAAYGILSRVGKAPAVLAVATYVGVVERFDDPLVPAGQGAWFSGRKGGSSPT